MLTPDYEYAPESRLRATIQASADDGGGWEPWRRESKPYGEMWYRRLVSAGDESSVIHGVEDDDEWLEADDDIDPAELAEVEAMEAEVEDRQAAAREWLEARRAEGGEDDFID